MRSFVLAILVAVVVLATAPAQPTTPPRLKVMTFNLRYSAAKDGENGWEHRKDFAFDRIKATAPDLLGVQEALPDQVDFLADKLPRYKVLGVGRDDGARKGEFSAIYLNTDCVTVTDSGTFWLSEMPEKPGSKSWDSALPRIVTWAKLTYRGQPEFKFVYVNTHWDHRGPKARLESAKGIRRWAREHAADLPVIMTGDLNANEASEPFKHLIAGDAKEPVWIDGYRQVHSTKEKEEASFNGFKGTRVGSRIDFVVHSRHFRTVAAEIDRSERNGRYPSDHYPVWAEVEYIGQ